MKSSRNTAIPNEISVSYIYKEYPGKVYYFENLNLFFIWRCSGFYEITVHELMIHTLFLTQNSYTKQLSDQINNTIESFKINETCISEETEQIFLQSYLEKIICIVYFVDKQFQTKMINCGKDRIYNFRAFENYLMGDILEANQKCVLIYRKNKLKFISRQIILRKPCDFDISGSFHLLSINLERKVLFYIRESSKLKIIRKYQQSYHNKIVAFNGRYFAAHDNESHLINIVDSTDMKTQQQVSSINCFQQMNIFLQNFPVLSSPQLGLFFIIYRKDRDHCDVYDKSDKQYSIKLEENSFVQIIRAESKIGQIKYFKDLGLKLIELGQKVIHDKRYTDAAE